MFSKQQKKFKQIILVIFQKNKPAPKLYGSLFSMKTTQLGSFPFWDCNVEDFFYFGGLFV